VEENEAVKLYSRSFGGTYGAFVELNEYDSLSDARADPERDLRILYAQLQTAEETIYDFQVQLDELSSKLDHQTSYLESQVEEWRSEQSSMQSTLAELEGRYTELQSTLHSSRNITYVALGVAIVAILMAVVMAFRRRARIDLRI